ncbi:hypothetical protein B0H21DRAFT_876090 [Amylocystis lapponica]|nr:hypothetical protein B0H21DRAFT_876090 [Amylocystis lapponica]
MGVPGLWDILRPAGETRSLTHLAVVDGFEANRDGKRGFRVGIDASIWFYHAAYGREGENPELRTLFFRCTRLMSAPFLPLFVFDGPKRPEIKRGKRISGKNHWMVQGMQEIINAFGFEWRIAPGEAEAELAHLNRTGVIDAVLSDDVDTFLFGATIVVRKRLILIGILRGGDYHPEGLAGCGGTIAHGLARCGFGDTLLTAARTLPRSALPAFLSAWRTELREELRTNARGLVGRKQPALAKSIPADFPDIDVLLSYTHPETSEHGRSRPALAWDKEPDLARIAGLCELYFEWGIKHIIIKRFRTVLWPSAVLRILRRAVLVADERGRRRARTDGAPPSTPAKGSRGPPQSVGTPSKMIARHFSSMHLGSPEGRTAVDDDDDEDAEGAEEEPLIVRIHSSRTHASTDGVLEYRLEVAPAQLVRLCEAGVKGLRTALSPELSDEDEEDDEDEDGDGPKRSKSKAKKPPPDPQSHLRIWLPACMVRIVEPELVDEFEGIQEMRQAKKAGKGKGSKAAGTSVPKGKGKKAVKAASTVDEEDEDEGSALPLPKKKSTKARVDAESASELPVPKKKLAAARTTKKAIVQASDSDSEPQRAAKKSTTVQATKKTVTKAKASSSASVGSQRRDGAKEISTSRKAVTDFFMASKGVQQPKAKVNSTATRGTALFGDSPPLPSPKGKKRAPFMEPRFVPQPFPMSFDKGDVRPNADDPFGHPSQSTQASTSQRTRPRSPASSGSDSSLAPLQKSPRKSPKHSSPRSIRTSGARVHDSGRAPSPSPLHASVIEISSDSDSPPATNLAPLLRARTKLSVKPQGALKPTAKSNEPAPKSKLILSDETRKKAVPRSRALNVEPEDIIDLT